MRYQIGGLKFGYSKCIFNVALVVILYFGMRIAISDPEIKVANVWMAIFAVVFGSIPMSELF
jgi:hypothetical protein